MNLIRENESSDDCLYEEMNKVIILLKPSLIILRLIKLSKFIPLRLRLSSSYKRNSRICDIALFKILNKTKVQPA